MGDRNSYGMGGPFLGFDPDGFKAIAHAQQTGEARAAQHIEAEKIAADAEATRYLAEMHVPADLVEWGRAHGIPTFAQVTWEAGFMQGWRMALAKAEMATRLGSNQVP